MRTYALNDWMRLLPDDRALYELCLCGTHDCVTKNIAFSHFLCCQSLDILSQLCLGVRALDIRVRPVGDRLLMVHGAVCACTDTGRKMDMADVLCQCYAFLQENPSECIVFQFKDDAGRDYEQAFANFYYTYICPDQEMWFLQNRVPRLGEARGKIVLIRRCKKDTSDKNLTDENSGLDFSHWVEQDTAEPDPLPLDCGGGVRFLVQDRYKYKPVPRWHDCIRPFLDAARPFAGTYVINYLSTAGGLKGPQKNAKIINSCFLQYPLSPEKYYGTVYVDFPTEALVRKLIEQNFLSQTAPV